MCAHDFGRRPIGAYRSGFAKDRQRDTCAVNDTHIGHMYPRVVVGFHGGKDAWNFFSLAVSHRSVNQMPLCDEKITLVQSKVFNKEMPTKPIMEPKSHVSS